MTSSPILRSAALQKSLALAPVRRSPATTPFAGVLAQTHAKSVSHTTSAASSSLTPAGVNLRPHSASKTVAASAGASSASGATSHHPLGIASRPRSALETVAASTDPMDSVPFQTEITAAANKYGVDPALLAGLVKQESNFNPSARSGVGAKGLTQDTPLADIWTQGRILQFADGPDEVHLRSIARQEVKAMQEQLTRNTTASKSPAVS